MRPEGAIIATVGFRQVCGLKGHESIAQTLAAGVCIPNGPALKGRQKIVFRQRGGIPVYLRGKNAIKQLSQDLDLEM